MQLIDGESWVLLGADVKGDIYEGLLQKNAEDTKSGAGQYFTPRPLIQAMVECVRPEPMKTIADPACGTGGFFLAAYDHLTQHNKLNKEQLQFLKYETFRGWEIVTSTARLCLMNLFLHNVGDMDHESPIVRDDSLRAAPSHSGNGSVKGAARRSRGSDPRPHGDTRSPARACPGRAAPAPSRAPAASHRQSSHRSPAAAGGLAHW